MNSISEEKKISVICRKIVRIIGIVMVGYLFLQGLFTICCIQRVSEKTYYIENNVGTQIGGIAVFLLFIRVMFSRKSELFFQKYGNRLMGGALLLVVAFLGFWVYKTQFWYASDMEQIYRYAGLLLAGDYSGWEPGGYPYMCPHQNGLLLFVAGLLKIFQKDTSYTVLYILNITAFAVTIGALFYALKLLYQEKNIYCLQTLLLIFYFPYSFFCLMLYGNVIAFAFASVAVTLALYYCRNQKWAYLIASALCMAVGICFKQNQLIILVGVLILLGFDWINHRFDRGLLAGILLYIAVVFVGMQAPEFALEQITGKEIDGGNSKWSYIAMGLMEDNATPGWYNNYNNLIFEENHYDKEATGIAAKEKVAELLEGYAADPAGGWRFFNYKLASEWNNPTFECFVIQNTRSTGVELGSLVNSTINDGGKINILFIYFFDILQSVIWFGVLMYLILAEDMDWQKLLYGILFIGGFLFFAAWEAKSQYVVYFFFMLIPYAVPGYMHVWKYAFQPEAIRAEKKVNPLYPTLLILTVIIVFLAFCDAQWVLDGFRIQGDTQGYYDYIHQYNDNFTNLRF